MSVKLLSKHHLEFLSLKGGCTGLSESTLVKMPYCWKSHVAAHMSQCPENYKLACPPIEDSDQPAQMRRLIRVSYGHSMGSQASKVSSD